MTNGNQKYDMVIHKHPIILEPTHANKVTVELPKGAHILTIQTQMQIPTIWFTRPLEETPNVKRTIYIFATGETIPKDSEPISYIGTLQFGGGMFVFHFFTGLEEGTEIGL